MLSQKLLIKVLLKYNINHNKQLIIKAFPYSIYMLEIVLSCRIQRQSLLMQHDEYFQYYIEQIRVSAILQVQRTR